MPDKIQNIISVKASDDYHLFIKFEDGFEKNIDFKTFIKNGISSQFSDLNLFKKVRVEFGTLVWDNGYELCPVTLREC